MFTVTHYIKRKKKIVMEFCASNDSLQILGPRLGPHCIRKIYHIRISNPVRNVVFNYLQVQLSIEKEHFSWN